MKVDSPTTNARLSMAGLMERGGPAAGAGVANLDAFFELANRLSAPIESGQPLSVLDWTRAVVFTEICWASGVVRAGSEFDTNLPDVHALPALRALQRKLVTGGRIQALIGLQG